MIPVRYEVAVRAAWGGLRGAVAYSLPIGPGRDDHRSITAAVFLPNSHPFSVLKELPDWASRAAQVFPEGLVGVEPDVDIGPWVLWGAQWLTHTVEMDEVRRSLQAHDLQRLLEDAVEIQDMRTARAQEFFAQAMVRHLECMGDRLSRDRWGRP